MKPEELREKEVELQDQLFKLRFQQATGQIENPGRIRAIRRDLARVKTILGEKVRAAGQQGAAVPATPDKAEKDVADTGAAHE
jgi:large subunit ribosomal protein L29